MSDTPLSLFRQGLDTLQICERLGGLANGWTEARVYNAISREKAEETALKSTTWRRSQLVRYAGYDRTTMPWSGQR